jgi:NADP-dependent 3-hydroxy acid dehydrogenase YdfG
MEESVMQLRPRSILITGATSGIGRALARIYAAPGIHLALTGRNLKRLEEISNECRANGAEVMAAQIDVRDRAKITTWIHLVDDTNPVDLVIASAGITSGLGLGRLREDPEAVRAVFAINLIGVLNTIDPLIERMCARGSGQIAIVGSIAAVRGLPYSPAYCAGKAAVHAYAESLRGALALQGVVVSLVVPGFVATALNKDILAPKPLEMSDMRAARIIRRGLDRGASAIPFPRVLYYGAQLLRFLPIRWVDFMLGLVHVDIPETRERTVE